MICNLLTHTETAGPDTPEAAAGVWTTTGESAEVIIASPGAHDFVDVTHTNSVYLHLL